MAFELRKKIRNSFGQTMNWSQKWTQISDRKKCRNVSVNGEKNSISLRIVYSNAKFFGHSIGKKLIKVRH